MIKSNFNTCGNEGPAGKDGSTPVIGSNGNWWINGVDTRQPAQGPRGMRGFQGEKGEQGIQGEKGDNGANGTNGTNGNNVLSANYTGTLSIDNFNKCKQFNQGIQLNSNLITIIGSYKIGDILYMVTPVTGKTQKQIIMLRVGSIPNSGKTLFTFYTVGVLETN